ncbi:MAG: acetate--CoA ligase family protein [Pigmentiphaga sp.]|uniref:acetate--CoA ligase family protein n=1 Tax=Pigmentiphaga sp. TaxID=1977564 RepID=UPI0029BBB7FE|nr:acetate--CoA ligase family protein [Pigmentiphaga sp.]MDX3907357.1 acetate--CoA ligase family protein [Pigmentiphaga sp.]
MTIDFEAAKAKVAALATPRNVVLVGATDRPGAWSAKVWRSLGLAGYEGNVYFINPRRNEIFGRPCYPDFASLPEPPDHLAVLVPAQAAVGAVRDGAAAGARSAMIFAAGFGEDGDGEGVVRRRELEEIAAQTGVAVAGPNVMGNLIGKSRFATLTNDLVQSVTPGPVALVGQSGGVLIHLNVVFLERGITPGYVLCTGNEAALSTPDYIAYLAGDPEVKVIVAYVEGIADVERFKEACLLARQASKPVIVLKIGRSDAGQQAVMAHTGSLAGSTEVFDAIAGEWGVMRAETTDDAVELVELLLYTPVPAGRRIGAITLSGAYRGLLLDAADKYGLHFEALAPATTARLESLFTVGAKVSNPLDGGFGVLTSEEVYLACIEALDDDPGIDMLLVQEELPRVPGKDRTVQYIRRVHEYVATRAKKPIAFVSFATHSRSDYSRDLKAQLPRLSFLNEPDKALRTIAKAIRSDEQQRLAQASRPYAGMPSADASDAVRRLQEDAFRSSVLNEAQSKQLLQAYGIHAPRETIVASGDQAVAAAEALGYPVVLKIASADIPHKSDVGGVFVNLRSADEVRSAYDRIFANLRRHGFAVSADAASVGAADPGIDVSRPGRSVVIDGVLVAQHVGGGVELVLGLHRDPEMGLVVMAGCGGVMLELIKDVAFAAPPVTAAKARDMLQSTRVGQLLSGYRGAPPGDIEAVVQALVALGRVAMELGDALASIDINPFVVLPEGQGAVALDALVILKGDARH